MLFKSLAVFCTAFVLDVCWAVYIRRTAAGRAVSAATFATVLYLLGAYNTMSFVNQPWLLAPIAAGAWLGTYTVIRWEHRGGNS